MSTSIFRFFIFLSISILISKSEMRAQEEPFLDPAHPEVVEVGDSTVEPVAAPFERLRFVQEAKKRAEGAINSDWPRFLGPSDDCHSPETHLLSELPENGLPIVWEMDKGTGYTSPVFSNGKLVFFDRIDDEERVDCLDAETGQRFWSYQYPVVYEDRYGFSNGPRASAVLDSGKIYTLGVTSILTCLDLRTGTKLWQRDLDEEFEVADYFFGHGACPVVYDGKVIVNLGGKGGLCVAAFDQHDGKLLWGTRHEWLASYASPIVKPLQGKPRLLVLAGGESRPATGGLLCIDPDTGGLLDDFSWRADKYESVNGSTPVVIGDDQVYISDCYDIGGVMLRLNEKLKWEEMWKAPEFGMHWMTPLVKEGNLYGFRGRNEPDSWLAGYDAKTGQEHWRKDFEWNIKLPGDRDYRMRFFRGSLLMADQKVFALGELGSLAILDLEPSGGKILSKTELFTARATWSLPVLHRGLLYVSQHEEDTFRGSGRRLICYDLRSGP